MREEAETSNRCVEAASWRVALLPTLSITIVSIAAAYIRLSFGKWPVAYRDTVHVPFADTAVTLTALATVAIPLVIFLIFPVAAFRAMASVRPVFGRWAVYLAVTWAIAYSLVAWDPSGYIDWVID